MTNEEKILDLLAVMQKDIVAIKGDVAELKGDVAELKGDVAELKGDVAELKADMADLKKDVADLKEAHEETRSGVNSLLNWAEECGNVIKFPLPKVK